MISLMISFTSRVHCAESGEESMETESVYSMKCHISQDVNHLHEGLKHVSNVMFSSLFAYDIRLLIASADIIILVTWIEISLPICMPCCADFGQCC
jgi:hypothetical protein